MNATGLDKDMEEFLIKAGIDEENARGLADYVVKVEGALETVEDKADQDEPESTGTKRLATKRLPDWMPAAKAWAQEYSTWLVNSHEIEVARCSWLKNPGKKSTQNAQKLQSFFHTMSSWLSAPKITNDSGEVRINIRC
jgi:hypothetical protein